MNGLGIIGRVERVGLPDLNTEGVPAKIDTGADSSAIWVSQVVLQADGLDCVFFGPGSEYYTGEVVRITKDYSVTRVANSFGHKEMRYKIKLRVSVKGRLIRATFTLSDRGLKTYPILLGRRLLQGKFLVDVSMGEPLREQERRRAQRLQDDLQTLDQEGQTP